MRAGQIMHRITFQKPTITRNAKQENITTYSNFITVWAAIDWESGRRFLEAKQLNSEVQGVIRIRYRSGILPEWRIKYKDRYFQILSIADIKELNREIQLNVKEAQD